MDLIKKCIKWYFLSFGNAYKGEGYRYYKLC